MNTGVAGARFRPFHRVRPTLKRQASIVRRYPFSTFLVLSIFSWVLFLGYDKRQLAHAIGYLVAVWVGTIVIDFLSITDTAPDFPIRKPAAMEVVVILGCTALGIAGLMIRFGLHWAGTASWPLLQRLGFGVLIIFFTFPVALVVLYLAVFRYRLSELGANVHKWYVSLPVIMIFGVTTLLVARQGITWQRAVRESDGIWQMLAMVFIAALSEEFLRMLLQTRLGRVSRNKGLGFVAATAIWACMHVPKFHFASGAPLSQGFIGAVNIMPVGFLWGYLTHRTKSLLPAVLVHGTNLWGLQNFLG